MKLILRGHDRYYALEQSLLNYFPRDGGGEALSALSRGGTWVTATTTVTLDERKSVGRARMRADGGGNVDHLLKMSFFRAARPLVEPPPWGALTGIRPAKKALEMLDGPSDPESVRRTLCQTYAVTRERAALAVTCALRARAARETLREGEVSLYVGIPFCPTRCAYCSFVSADVEKSGGLVAPYAEALAAEMGEIGPLSGTLGYKVRTVYWGGGTPTALSAAQLTLLMDSLKTAFDLSGVTEYTVEAGRPDTVTPEKLAALKAGGATRISVNPQTLEEPVLRAIGRAHGAGAFFEAFGLARAAGFDHINCDLIAGLPGDSPEGFARSLNAVLALRPENITVHTLARKRGARLSAEDAAPASDSAREAVAEMLDCARRALSEAGYGPYYLYRQKFTAGGFENVGWSLPGRECLYNLCMMEELHTVLSLGAGGVTKLAERGRIERIFQCKYPLEYLNRHDKIDEYKKRLREWKSRSSEAAE